MASKVMIEVEGGMVTGVSALARDVEVVVVDYDVEGMPSEERDEYFGRAARIREWDVDTGDGHFVGWWDVALTAARRHQR